ncbi:MAG: peptide chain release factor 2 [Desulfovibrionaceae bacterium]|nr:peptide chain release factor 2 [Desulfovibrionaceae bacterium]
MLQYPELKAQGAQLLEQFRSLWGRLDYQRAKDRLAQIETELAKPGAWNDPDKMTPLLQEKSRLKHRLKMYEPLAKAKDEAEEWLDMAAEDNGPEVLAALKEQLDILAKRLEDTETAVLLSEPQDQFPAILEIHPGAGGVESQDWAEMLLRMYTRWAEEHGFKVNALDLMPGLEAGIKSATIQIEGPYAYGFLKCEEGIHRLIRISPFDASGRRHTSFASVDVYPDVEQDIEIDIKEDDLRVDVFRASGPGGQHVNKTNSAVRITHLPTNIVVQCQNEKSQFKNKATAMKILKARLYEAERERIEETKRADYEGKEAIAWGSQIRSYTLQPYRLVKDHRSQAEVGNVDAVLDGELDGLIRSQLLHAHAQKQQA